MPVQGCAIFISHASADQEIAQYLKDQIVFGFPSASVFVSSDPEDLALGDEWVDKILNALRSAQYVLVLATKRGLERKWVWFEAGRTWFSGIDMVPCCIGTSRKGNLPAPFSGRMSANIDESNDIKSLFRSLGDKFGPIARPMDFEEIARTLIRLDVRAEERQKIQEDPNAQEIRRAIESTMQKLPPVQRETIRQVLMYGELSTASVRTKLNALGMSTEQFYVLPALEGSTGWLSPTQILDHNDDRQQNRYEIVPRIRPYLEEYFARHK